MTDKDLSSVFLFKLDNATKQFRKYKNRIFKEEGLDITSDQWILLKNIHEIEGINQTELGKKAKKESAAVTRTLDILVRKNWVVRKSNPESRRVYNLYTTTSGRKMVNKILPIALAVRKQARLNLTEKEIKLLNLTLDKISDNLE